MKKLFLLLLIGLSVFSFTKVYTQTVNWVKGSMDIQGNYPVSWSNLSVNKKLFYTVHPQNSYYYINIYDTESGDLIKKVFQKSGMKRYLIDDSTFIRIGLNGNDSINQWYISYSDVNNKYEKDLPFVSFTLEFNGNKIDINRDEYEEFISENELLFLAQYKSERAIIYWDIKSKCISDIFIQKDLGTINNINTIAYDKSTNILYYSDAEYLYKFNCFTKKVLLKVPFEGVTALSLSNNSKYLAFKYFLRDEIDYKFVVLNSDDFEIEHQSSSSITNFNEPAAISLNSRLFAFQNSDGQLEIYDLITQTSQNFKTLFTPSYIRFINDKEIIITSEEYGFSTIFDVAKGIQVNSLIVNDTKTQQIKYSHNGEFLAVLGYDFIKVLDASTGDLRNIFQIKYEYLGKYYNMDFSKNDDKIIFSENTYGYYILNLRNNTSDYNKTDSKVISTCYSTEYNDILAFGTENGYIIVANDKGNEIIKTQIDTGLIISALMFSEHNKMLYYSLFNKQNLLNETLFWDYKLNIISEVKDCNFEISKSDYSINTFYNRYLTLNNQTYDIEKSKMIGLNLLNLPVFYQSSLFNLSKDGLFSVFGQFSESYKNNQMFCNLCKNDLLLGDQLLKSIYIPDYLPLNSNIIGDYGVGMPEINVISPDNKNLILGLDCGSIISLNIENLTPVEDEVKLSDGFRIVNVENKDTYLNCEISSANEFDSFDYYIYDLNGKLLNQGTLGTVGQGSNTITINYSKKMLYPAILLVKSRENNTYQSKLFY